mgnify:CR=1 FL=1
MSKQSIFEQLAPYAKMTVVPGVTVGQLTYANTQVLTTAAVFTSVADAAPIASSLVGPNTAINLFLGALTEVAQGWTTAMTLSQTNSRFSKGQPPANQVFVGTHFGVTFSKTGDTSPAAVQTETLFSADDLFGLLHNFSWDLTIGRGITRTIGTLMEYPDLATLYAEVRPSIEVADTVTPDSSAQNGSPWGVSAKLPIPVVFPPLVNVQIVAQNGSGFNLRDEGNNARNIVLRASFKGFLMTMPV